MLSLEGRRIILASASPRRKELLSKTGISFEVLAADVDESEIGGETPEDYCKRLALKKARTISQKTPDVVVIGADTVVAINEGESWLLLGKPADSAEAIEMLLKLEGREHSVVTGFSLCCGAVAFDYVEAVETRVRFRSLSVAEISAYVEAAKPFDKAGAYGIQGLAEMFVPEIHGSYTNVVGLPMSALLDVLMSCRLWQAEDLLKTKI